ASPEAAPEVPLNNGGCSMQIDLQLQRPPRAATKLTKLSGEFVFAVPGDKHKYIFKKFGNGARQSEKFGETIVTLEGARPNGKVGLLVVGRICTPQAHKWPALLTQFYRQLAERFPRVRWEFVGCPAELQPALQDACQGRTTFWTAGWERRSLLTTWDALLYHQPALPESFGRTVAEAMRVGCVPVVDAQGGFIEQLEHGGGFVCRGVDEFATAIERLHSRQQLSDVSRTAERIGNERWSLDRFAKELLTRFDGALDRRAGGRQSPR
ncbi:MAG: hypothetical protein B7Z55_19005, partial [Planctomycetales bacterium 12-60-4]